MRTRRACHGGTKWRRGQALMELAVGMFTIALLLSASFFFVKYIVRSLEIQNHLRSPGQATYEADIDLDKFAANEVFGLKNLPIMEPRGATDRSIQ